MRMSVRRAPLRPARSFLGVLFGLVVGLVIGAMRPDASADARPDSTYALMDLFAEVFGNIQDRYVEPVDDQELMYHALEGMVGSLDPHSRFMDPEAFAAMREDTRGEYVGVGMQVMPGDDGVRVGEVFEGGPAFDAGIQTDDVILAIDGEDASGWDADQIVRVLRGPRGEPVSITVERGGDPITFELVRDVIHMTAVVSSMPVPGYGVVEIRGFQNDTGNEVRAAIDRLQAEHGGDLDGIILDLRGNPGGLLNEAISVSDAFLASGTIVSTAGRDPDEGDAWEAQRSNTRYRGPLVVLVDGGSASASEIVAGALQDNGRAVVVGTRTYGKGSVQSIIELTGGAGMKLTVSLYYTPSGRSIQGRGITPDLTVEAGQYVPDDAPTREASLSGSLANPGADDDDGFDLSGVTDRQLRAALQQLHAFSIFASAEAE